MAQVVQVSQQRPLQGPYHLFEIRFCAFQGVDDVRGAIQQCDKATTMLFLCFICENYKVKAFNSVHQYLLQFKQLYNRVNGRHMDTNDAKEVFKVCSCIQCYLWKT